jgi:hypothetical protein
MEKVVLYCSFENSPTSTVQHRHWVYILLISRVNPMPVTSLQFGFGSLTTKQLHVSAIQTKAVLPSLEIDLTDF